MGSSIAKIPFSIDDNATGGDKAWSAAKIILRLGDKYGTDNLPNLTDLADVDIVSPLNNRVLKYNGTSAKWEVGLDDTDVTSGGQIDGAFEILNTDGGATKYLSVARVTDSSVEGIKMYIDDTQAQFLYKNDEASGSMRWSVNNTDTEGVNTGTLANTSYLTFSSASTETELKINASSLNSHAKVSVDNFGIGSNQNAGSWYLYRTTGGTNYNIASGSTGNDNVDFTGDVTIKGILTSNLNRTVANMSVREWSFPVFSTPDRDFYRVAWSPDLGIFASVAYNGGSLAEAGNRAMTSEDGHYWTSRSTPADHNWHNIIWVSELGLFVAAGRNVSTTAIMTSPDGITWTSRTTPSIGAQGLGWSPELGILTVLGASGKVMTSTDGITWTDQGAKNALTDTCNGVAWSPELSLFVAVGLNSTVSSAYSSDGINWTAGIANVRFSDVVWADKLGLFVASIDLKTGQGIYTSTDGINWTARTTPGSKNWTGVAWSSELSMLVTTSTSTTTEFNISYSFDGIKWHMAITPVNGYWSGLTWSPELGIFVAVSNSSSAGVDKRVLISR